MPTSNLRMTFEDSDGSRRSISIRNPVDNPDAAEVETLMDAIIDNDVFIVSGNSLVDKVSAVVVTTQTNVITDFSE